jgi:hypothetical protein
MGNRTKRTQKLVHQTTLALICQIDAIGGHVRQSTELSCCEIEAVMEALAEAYCSAQRRLEWLAAFEPHGGPDRGRAA